MTLTDTGPLVALLNRNDPNHGLCTRTAKGVPGGPLVTTWPCFTEAMYLLHKAGGHPAQEALWLMRTAGRLLLHNIGETEMARKASLMAKYRDLPMDLADASLIAAAECLKTRCIFSLDKDFRVYRFGDGSSVVITP